MRQITENQFGSIPRRSTTEVIYLVRRLMERYKKSHKNLCMIFIDLKNIYDRVTREILPKALKSELLFKKCVKF